MGAPIDGLLGQALSTLGVRERVLANDVANADTPGFAAQDVTFAGALAHRLGQAQPPNPLAPVTVAAPGLMQANGNGVDLEAALIDLTQNAMTEQGVEQVLGSRFATLQTSITSLEGA
jgi:flagellar basal-body rod protein FlgB